MRDTLLQIGGEPRPRDGSERRWPLAFQGSDVGLRARFTDGRVRVVYLDRDGRARRGTIVCQVFQLRGAGRHLAEIKRAVELLPLDDDSAVIAAEVTMPPPPAAPAPRSLYAHHVAAAMEREDR